MHESPTEVHVIFKNLLAIKMKIKGEPKTWNPQDSKAGGKPQKTDGKGKDNVDGRKRYGRGEGQGKYSQQDKES